VPKSNCDFERIAEKPRQLSAFYVSPGTNFNVYQAQTEYPSVAILQIDEATEPRVTANAKDIFSECKSAGQRKALEMLTNIARVRHEFPDIAGISIPPAAMLIGMSGSGKTWVAKSFAKLSKWPFFETTVSGWSPINSKADSWTLLNIRRVVSDSPAVILIDEADKIGTRSGGRFESKLVCRMSGRIAKSAR
jgi:AAA+ superfamily predicted ATPase